MDVPAVERSFVDLLAAFGDLVVARTRGAPADPAGGSTRALARRYCARRRAFADLLAEPAVRPPAAAISPRSAPGASVLPADLLRAFLGGPVTARPLLADLARPT